MSIFWGQGFAQHPVSIINASKSLVCLSKVTCKVDHCLKCIFFTYWNEHISFPYSALFNRDDHLTESCYVRSLDTVLHLFLGHFLSTIKTLTQDFNWEVRGNFLFSVENGVKVIEIILMSVRGKLNRKREQRQNKKLVSFNGSVFHFLHLYISHHQSHHQFLLWVKNSSSISGSF